MTANHRPNQSHTSFAYLSIATMMIGYCMLAPWSAVSGDFSRDMRIASDILSGEQIPLKGPVLASHFHLGPIWYYMLAGLQWIGLGYFGTVLIIAFLGALQFPLFYLVGKAVLNARSGLLWAALMLVPSWGTYEQVFPGHTSLTATLTAATLLMCVRYWRTGKAVYLPSLALFGVLAVHAHPTSLLLMPIVMVAAVAGWLQGRTPTIWVFGAGLAALLPLVPYLAELMMSGESPFEAWAAYNSTDQSKGSLTQIPALLWALTGDPLHYWLTAVSGWRALPSQAIAVAWTAVIVTGIGVAGACHRNRPFCYWLVFFTLMAAIVLMAQGRAFFPYYMFTVVRALLLGLTAAGLVCIFQHVRFNRTMALAVMVSISLYGSVLIPAIQHQHKGSWPFAFVPLFMTTHAKHQPAPLAMTTAHGMRTGGRWLCQFPEIILHGSWAQMQVISFGIERKLVCNIGPQVLGGSQAGQNRWLALSKSLWDELQLKPVLRAGNFGLVPVAQVVGPGSSIAVPDDLADPPQPPLPIRTGNPEQWSSAVDLKIGDVLAISNLAFGISAPPIVSLRCGEVEYEPNASDRVSTIYARVICPTTVELVIQAVDLAHVDVVTFRAAQTSSGIQAQ